MLYACVRVIDNNKKKDNGNPTDTSIVVPVRGVA
jgi:hypothetical protein